MSETVKELRMDAYYYGFVPTGDKDIDLILCAVASAGKAYHHTEEWNKNTRPYDNTFGESPSEWIQNAANKAAINKKMTTQKSITDKAIDALEYARIWLCSIPVLPEGGNRTSIRINEALAALRAHNEVCDGWLPIDTAPLDLTVLVYTCAGEMGLATREQYGWAKHGITLHSGKDNSPKYWKLLPAAPKKKLQKDGIE